MLTAVYYPFTNIQSQSLIKTALLFWDSVECIVPSHTFQFRFPFQGKVIREACELIIKPHVPDNQQRQIAHADVVSFLRNEGNRFFFRSVSQSMRQHNYLIYAEKFIDNTWEFLTHHDLAHWDGMAREYGVAPQLGLLMMSALANACAGSQKQKLTDQTQAYSLLEWAKSSLLEAPYVEGLDASEVAPDFDRLVTLSLETLNARSIPIKKLLEFRKKELKGKSADYRTMRHNYMKALKGYIDRMRKEAKTAADVKEIERQFKSDLRDDLLNLKHELKLASTSALFNKDLALSMLVSGGSFVKPISGLTNLAILTKGIGIIPLKAIRNKHKEERRKAFLSHQISWLYRMKEPPLTMY